MLTMFKPNMKSPVGKSHYMIGLIIGVSFVIGVLFSSLQSENKLFSRFLQIRLKQNKTFQTIKDQVQTVRQVQKGDNQKS